MSGLGSGGLGASRFSNYRHGNLDARNRAFKYPSQWWDVAHMNMPTTVKHLFRWCRYHALVNPLVASVVNKLSAYPITKVLIDDEPEEGFDKHVQKWKELLFRVINIESFQLEAGLDYHAYGNCIVSILYPFRKYLSCSSCGFRKPIKRLKFGREWDFKDYRYHLKCPKCSHEGVAGVRDHSYLSYQDIKLIRWNPEDIEIDFNPVTRTAEYAYKVPQKIRTKVVKKHKRTLEEMPAQLIEAMRVNRLFVLTPENVFHFKAPTPSLAANDEGWGYPPILPALKDSFHLQIMKKAQEAVMLEHLIPLDIFFPASADASANPYLSVNLADWKSNVEKELVQHRLDPNYKPVFPLPIGHQRVGGNGRSLMLTQEIRAWSEHIIAGMDVPQEFIFGGLSYSGSSVSLRMLENKFMNYRDMHVHFLQHFLIPRIARFMRWKEIKVTMKAFKMADDLQQKQLLVSLNQMKKISDKTLLAEFGKDAADESKMVEQEMQRNMRIERMNAMHQAEMQGEQGLISTKYQLKAQERMQAAQGGAQEMQMGPDGQPMEGEENGGGAPPQAAQGRDAGQVADAYARRLAGLQPDQRQAVLTRMEAEMPELHGLVMQRMSQLTAQQAKPNPEQRPSRSSAPAL